MIPTACLSRVKQYKAAKDRYFHLAVLNDTPASVEALMGPNSHRDIQE